MKTKFLISICVLILPLVFLNHVQAQVTAPQNTILEDDSAHYTADVPPEFPGGQVAMSRFISKNIKYPGQAKRMGELRERFLFSSL